MKKVTGLIVLLLVAASVFAQNRVEATNRGISNARPGDYIVRSNGQRVILNQGDIDYARRQLGQSTAQTRPAASTANNGNASANTSPNKGIVIFLLIVVGVGVIVFICVANITKTIAQSAGMDEKSAKKLGASVGTLAGTAAAIGAAVLLGNSGGTKPDKNNITVTHRHL